MSQMKELYAKVAVDVTLQGKFTDIIKNAEAAGKEETGAKLVAFAKEAGYDGKLVDFGNDIHNAFDKLF